MSEVFAEDILKQAKKLDTPDKPTSPKTTSLYAEDILKGGVITKKEYDATPAYLEDSLYKKVSEQANKRHDNVKTVIKEAFSDVDDKSLEELMKRPDISSIAKTALGQTAGAFMDLSAELVMEGIDLIVPDSIEKAVKDKVVSGINYVTTSPAMKPAIEALKEGADSYAKWKRDNPVSAIELESVVNIGTFLLPPTSPTRRTIAPSVTPEDPLLTKLSKAAQGYVEQASQSLKGQAAKQIDKRKKAKAYQYVMPTQIKEDRIKDVQGRTFFKDAKLTPDKLEAETIDYVASLDINPSKGLQHNYNVIRKAGEHSAKMLDFRLKVEGATVDIPHTVTKARIKSKLGDMVNDPLLQPQDNRRVFDKFIKDLDAMVDATGTKPSDVLGLRKELDKYLTQKFNFFGKEQPVWLDNMGKEARNAINNVVDEAVGDKVVSDMLRKQHLSFMAQKGLAPKAAKQIESVWNDLFKNTSKVLGENVRMSRVLAYSTVGASGFASVMGILPMLTGGVAITGLGTMALKGALSPTAKKSLAYMLDMSNKAIAKSTNPATIKELRAGRSMVLELMQLPVEEETEQAQQQ